MESICKDPKEPSIVSDGVLGKKNNKKKLHYYIHEEMSYLTEIKKQNKKQKGVFDGCYTRKCRELYVAEMARQAMI